MLVILILLIHQLYCYIEFVDNVNNIFYIGMYISTLTVVNVSRNGRGALYKPLKLLTLKTRKMHLNRPFKVLHSLHLLTDKPYMQ